MKEFEKAAALLQFYSNSFAELSVYNWGDSAKLGHINDTKEIIDSFIERNGRIDISKFTRQQLLDLGFKRWRDKESTLLLAPLWIFPHIKDGIKMKSITGEYVSYSEDLDKDIRFGVTAYGIDVGFI